MESSSSLFARGTQWLAFAFVLAAYLLLADSPGTSDVPLVWFRWLALIQEHGVIGGYAAAQSDYLPGAFAMLGGIERASSIFHVSVFSILKLTIIAFALFGSLAYWLWTRSVWKTIALLIALLLSSAAHAYLDALYLPFLVLMILGLQGRHNFAAGLCLGLSLCFKWQPLLITPFALIYLCDYARAHVIDRESWRRVGLFLLGAAVPSFLQISIVGPGLVATSFLNAMDHPALSLQALNVNWVIQMALYKWQNLNWTYYFETEAPRVLTTTMDGMAMVMYGGIAAMQFLRGRTFDDFLWCALAGSLGYFAVHTGVHENHLFVAMIVGFCLLSMPSMRSTIACCFVAISFNVNLLLFYGVQGQTAIASRFTDVVSVLFSLINTAFFVLCFFETMRLLIASERRVGPVGIPASRFHRLES